MVVVNYWIKRKDKHPTNI